MDYGFSDYEEVQVTDDQGDVVSTFFRPHGVADGQPYTSNDLTPPGKTKTRCFVASPDALQTGGGVIGLGTDKDASVSAQEKGAIENALGITLSASTIANVVAELFLDYGDEANPDRWNPVRAMVDGITRIFLGGLLWSSVGGGATITESFDKADSDTLGPDLTWTELEGDWDVVTNQVRLQSFTGSAAARADHDLNSDGHYAQVDYVSTQGGEGKFGPLVRKDSSTTLTFYRGLGRGEFDDTQLDKVESGSVTTLASGSFTFSLPDTLRIEVNGSSLDFLINGASQLTATDSAITGNLRTGLAGKSDNDQDGDNFEAGDLAAAILGSRFISSAPGRIIGEG